MATYTALADRFLLSLFSFCGYLLPLVFFRLFKLCPLLVFFLVIWTFPVACALLANYSHFLSPAPEGLFLDVLDIVFYRWRGRVFMSGEGGVVRGGLFWRIYCLFMCMRLTFSPSRDKIVLRLIPAVLKVCFRFPLGRVVLCVEGDSGASFAWLCVYTRLFHPPRT